MGAIKKILPHVLVIVGFALTTLIYFKPALSGKVLVQADMKALSGNTKETVDFYKKYGERTFWSRSLFLGMPNYIQGGPGAKSYDYFRYLALDKNPMDWPLGLMFSYLVCFYILMQTLGVNKSLSFLGSLAFAFSTYLIIIIQVGHITKSFAISYFPLAISGLILLIRGKNLWGFIAFLLGLYLAIRGSHYQMVYYLMMILAIIFLVYFITDFRKNGKLVLKKWTKTTLLLATSGLLALGTSAGRILIMKQFGKYTIRGETYLTVNPDGTSKEDSKGGLDKDYINQYSYGFAESMNLFIPGFVGGSNAENIGKDSQTYRLLLRGGYPPSQARTFVKYAPTYWGDQPIVAAPQYLGAVVVFLFALAFYFIKGRVRLWVSICCILAWVLSLGKNMSLITDLFIEYAPLYNKFRAVASIQVIIQTLVPMFAILGLYRFFSDDYKTDYKIKALKRIALGFGVFMLTILLFHNALFDFSAPLDQQFPYQLAEAIKEDRVSMMVSDTLRTLLLMGLAALALFFFLKQKLSKNVTVVGLIVLVAFDQISVARKYLNDSHFRPYSKRTHEFIPNMVEKQIMKDTSVYRVLDMSANPWSNSRASYFFNSVGGYSPAKLRRVQDLYEFYIFKMHPEVLKACNTKYIIYREQQSNKLTYKTQETYGSAWFIKSLKVVDDADQEMLALGEENLKDYAVVNRLVYDRIPRLPDAVDTMATLELKEYLSNYEYYQSDSQSDQFIVFSEMYYPHDWEATIDGKKASYYRVNYFMRGLFVPKGSHKIEFRFEPKLLKIGDMITIVSQILTIVVIGFLVFLERRKTLNS